METTSLGWLAWDCCSGEYDEEDWDQDEGESVGEPVLLVWDPQVSLPSNVDWWSTDRRERREERYLGAAIFLLSGATAEDTHRRLLSLRTVEAWQDESQLVGTRRDNNDLSSSGPESPRSQCSRKIPGGLQWYLQWVTAGNWCRRHRDCKHLTRPVVTLYQLGTSLLTAT